MGAAGTDPATPIEWSTAVPPLPMPPLPATPLVPVACPVAVLQALALASEIRSAGAVALRSHVLDAEGSLR